MEADLVPKHGIEIDFIRISGLRGKGIKALIAAWKRYKSTDSCAAAYLQRLASGAGDYESVQT